jgi:hypothetical protein
MDPILTAFVTCLVARGYTVGKLYDQTVVSRGAHGSTPACEVVIEPWAGGGSRVTVRINCVNDNAFGRGGSSLPRLGDRLNRHAHNLLHSRLVYRPHVADELHRIVADMQAALSTGAAAH